MNKNIIAFRKNLVTTTLNNTTNEILSNKVIELQHLLLTYGYILSFDAFEKLNKSNINYIDGLIVDLNDYFTNLIGTTHALELEELVSVIGDNVYTSIQSYCQLLWDGKINENIKQVYERVEFTEINFVDENDFKKIFTNYIQINTALTPTDFEVIEWFAKEYGNNNIMPNEIPFKENLCMVASLGLDVPVKTSTDVLRIATYMSNGTTDLYLPPKTYRPSSWSNRIAENPARETAKFKKFKRSERKYLLSLLEKCANPKEMVLKRGRWLRLGEILHPGDYSNRFPLSANSFKILRENNIKSWYSDVDSSFRKSFKLGLSKLSERPGEFARRLDSLLRNNTDHQLDILKIFSEVGENISSKVLWELYTHFNSRDTIDNERKIWIKGADSPTKLKSLPILEQWLIDTLLDKIISLITDRFSKLDKLGKVYIDPELKKIPAPTNMRNIQESTAVVIRGTRTPIITDKKVIRAYVHWTAGVDLDLSINFVDFYGNTSTCHWDNITPHENVRHSGDVIPEVPGDWAEYVDIKLENNPYKYGLVTVRNFSGGTLDKANAVVGFMSRDNLKSSTKWKPDTVETSYKVSAKASNVNVLVIDFTTMEWILIDEADNGIPIEYKNNINKYIKSLATEPKLSVYDILDLHVLARGSRVDNIEDCDTSFNFNEFSTTYEKISKLML